MSSLSLYTCKQCEGNRRGRVSQKKNLLNLIQWKVCGKVTHWHVLEALVGQSAVYGLWHYSEWVFSVDRRKKRRIWWRTENWVFHVYMVCTDCMRACTFCCVGRFSFFLPCVLLIDQTVRIQWTFRSSRELGRLLEDYSRASLLRI